MAQFKKKWVNAPLPLPLHFHTNFEDRSRTTVFEEKWNVFMMVEEIFLQYRRWLIVHARRVDEPENGREA